MIRVLSFFLILACSITARAEEANFSKPLTYLEYSAYILIAGQSSVYLHEVGHFLAAKAVNAKTYGIEMGLLEGRTFVQTSSVSKDELNLIFLSGAGANRLNASWSGHILDYSQSDTALRRFGSAFYLYNRLMIPFLWMQGLATENDLTKSRNLWSRNQNARAIIYASYGAIIAGDIWLSWDSIKLNWVKFLGRDARVADERSAIVSVFPQSDGFAASVAWSF